MDTDFVVSCQLVRRRRPLIQFLYIGPYLCSTLPSNPASRRGPCASLPFTSSRLGRDSHPQAVEHARRTTRRGELIESPPLQFFSQLRPTASSSLARAWFLVHSRFAATIFAVVIACPTCRCVWSATCTNNPPTVVGSNFVPTGRGSSKRFASNCRRRSAPRASASSNSAKSSARVAPA
jgi:hypothetical protein